MFEYNKRVFGKRLIPEFTEIDIIDNFIQSFPLPMFIKNIDDKCLACNKAFEDITGKKKNEIVNNYVVDVWGAANIFLERDKELYSSGNNQSYEAVLVTSNGINKNVVCNKAIYRDRNGKIVGLVCSLLDITERNKIENDIVLKSLVLDQIRDLVTITSLNGEITYVNQAQIDTLGYSKEQIIGKTIQIFGEDAQKGATQKEILDQTIKNGRWNCEVVNFNKEGKEIIINCRTQVIKNNHGEPIAISGVSTDITQVKRTQDELIKARENEEELKLKFRMAFDYSGIGMAMVSLDKKFIRVNKALCDVWGYREEELIGKSFLELTFQDDLLIGSEEIKKCTNGEINTFSIKKRYLKKSGEPVWMNLTAAMIRNIRNEALFFVTQFENITKQVNYEQDLIAAKEAAEKNENSLKTQNKLFSVLLDNLTQGVFMVEVPTGKPILANNAAKTILGRGIADEASEKNLALIYKAFKSDINTPYPVDEMPIILGMYGQSVYIDDMLVQHPDGRFVNLEVFGTPVKDNEGKIWASLVSFTDITERKKIQNELILAKEKAEESDRLKTAFLQNMSHEIRTPMNAIMGFSDLLVHHYNDKAKLEKFSTIINQRCNDLLNIINDILDIAKIESGQLSINNEPFVLSEICIELSAFFCEHQKKIGKEHIVFSLKDCDSDKELIIADKVKLKQILINLITNAFKFTEKGQITGGYKYENNQLLFHISDTGIGIDPQKQETIFERFTQLEYKANRSVGGTGLGLSIVKGLVNLLGGEIWLESIPNKGTTFYFTLPVQFAKAKTNPKLKIENLFAHNMRKKSILVVEDDPFNKEYINEIIKNFPAEITYCDLGTEAIEKVRNRHFDILLLDIRLPDISGFNVAKTIRGFNPDIIIIAQTAYASNSDKEMAFESGCNDYISKPYSFQSLLEMINKYN